MHDTTPVIIEIKILLADLSKNHFSIKWGGRIPRQVVYEIETFAIFKTVMKGNSSNYVFRLSWSSSWIWWCSSSSWFQHRHVNFYDNGFDTSLLVSTDLSGTKLKVNKNFGKNFRFFVLMYRSCVPSFSSIWVKN